MKNDLAFENDEEYSLEKILATLTLNVYPRSMAGLNLNPNKEETGFQFNQVELLLKRVCQNTYLMESGWEIVRKQGTFGYYPAESTCEFKNGI